MNFVPPTSRYRLYFDETGNGDLDAAEKHPNERYLSITGVVVKQDTHDGYLTRRMNRLKEDIFGAQEVVLHRRDIMRSEGDFVALRNVERRQEFDWRMSSIIAECLIAAFTISIDKLEHKQRYKVWRYSPYHYLLECLLERFVLWLRRNNFQGDMLGEARNPRHDKQLRRAFTYFYKHKTGMVDSQMIQARLTSKDLRLLPKEKNIAGLQIADLLAHPCHRSLKFEQLGEAIGPDHGTYLVGLLRRYWYDRNPNSGVISGYGTKWLP
ncbi:DUF3800 domain-containing protein [Parasphingopyxis lamellibrachiae]|uniref:Uncharacterized protein DUF3800 n=1 Tax=Parasphingopyxis lamellibrachiae TaxID=680125 RepID=A0A3D9FH61_9SPHN|nr:DUF3800 domain-containing protein [Parasphingopyxis lamellibrachiae]RED17130.1 uncharacterized protein DUF3800 [Parasphingopyxis lamellibrachiae]